MIIQISLDVRNPNLKIATGALVCEDCELIGDITIGKFCFRFWSNFNRIIPVINDRPSGMSICPKLSGFRKINLLRMSSVNLRINHSCQIRCC